MLLCIDIGNTDTKLGFFGVPASGLGLEMVAQWRVTTLRPRTSDEYGVLFTSLFSSEGIALGAVRGIAMSSVVPQVNRDLRDGCKRYFKVDPLVLSARTQQLMEVRTERPNELGSDMLAAAIGARGKYGVPAIVIGYGTATTFSAISRDGAFLGTAIAPGIQISIDALVARAAKLPQVAFEPPRLADRTRNDRIAAIGTRLRIRRTNRRRGRAFQRGARPRRARDCDRRSRRHRCGQHAGHRHRRQAARARWAQDCSGKPKSLRHGAAMNPKPLRIGPHEIWPPIVLAPMSGVTNRTMRALYKPFGFGLTVTEFVSSNALQFGSKRTMEMIDQHGVERPVSTQLWGSDPAVMAYAAKVVRECGADIVDINFGCPAPKVTKTEGGSACLRDPQRCEAIMKAVVEAVDCPVTMKMRLGWSENAMVFIDVAKRAQSVGIAGLDAARAHGEAILQGQRGLGADSPPQSGGRYPRHRQRRSERSARRDAAHA